MLKVLDSSISFLANKDAQGKVGQPQGSDLVELIQVVIGMWR